MYIYLIFIRNILDFYFDNLLHKFYKQREREREN